jgi:hypothetical protein
MPLMRVALAGCGCALASPTLTGPRFRNGTSLSRLELMPHARRPTDGRRTTILPRRVSCGMTWACRHRPRRLTYGAYAKDCEYQRDR